MIDSHRPEKKNLFFLKVAVAAIVFLLITMYFIGASVQEGEIEIRQTSSVSLAQSSLESSQSIWPESESKEEASLPENVPEIIKDFHSSNSLEFDYSGQGEIGWQIWQDGLLEGKTYESFSLKALDLDFYQDRLAGDFLTVRGFSPSKENSHQGQTREIRGFFKGNTICLLITDYDLLRGGGLIQTLSCGSI